MTEEKKKSFLLYLEHEELINELSDEDAGELFKKMFEYVKTGSMPELNGMAKIAFISIRQDLDRNEEKYNDILEKRRIAGAKGGKQKALNKTSENQDNDVANVANVANANFAKINSSKSSYNDNVNVNDNVNDNDIYNNKLIKFKKPTIKEIEEYCLERNNSIDSRYFYDYYESKGWLIGKTKMKDFKAAIRLWEQNQKKFEQQKQTEQEEEDFDYDNTPYRPF